MVPNMSYIAASAFLLALAILVRLFTDLERQLIAAIRTGKALASQFSFFKKNSLCRIRVKSGQFGELWIGVGI